MNRPEALRRHAAKQAAFAQRFVLGAGLFIALGAIGFGLWREARDPRFNPHLGAVRGLAHESEADVVAAMALAPDGNAWLIDRRAVRQRLEALPWVSTASVNVAWPNEVSVDLTERVPAARVELPQAQGQIAVPAVAVIDETQRVLVVSTDPQEYAQLPRLVVDPAPRPASAGQTLADRDVAQALSALRELRALGLTISAVAVAPSTGISATADRNLHVLFGDDEELAAKAQLFKAIVAKISTAARIAYVDVRSVRAPTVLYR